MTSTPPTEQQLDEIETRTDARRTALSGWINCYSPLSEQETLEDAEAVLAEDVPALLAEVRRLRAELAAEQRRHGDTIDDRDRAQDAADKLAYAVAPENVIGEHTADNSPWENALDLLTPMAEVDKLRTELAAFEMLTPQQCPAGKHADWLVDSEFTHACPWCQIEGLRAELAAARGQAIAWAADAVDAKLTTEPDHNRASALYELLLGLRGELPCTCARSGGLHAKGCRKYVPGHEQISRQNQLDVYRAAAVAPDAASEVTSAPLCPSQPSSVSESAQSPTGASTGPRRALTPNEYNAAWHAVEGAAGDEGADPGTVLHAVLDRLGIDAPTNAIGQQR